MLLRVLDIAAVWMFLANCQDQAVAIDVSGVDGVRSTFLDIGAAADTSSGSYAEFGCVSTQTRY
jgi:hypothetical protein